MRKTGTVFIILGAALLAAALALFAFNRQDNAAAEQAVVEVMPRLVEQIRAEREAETAQPNIQDHSELEMYIPVELLTEEDVQMEELEVDGDGYIGYITMPSLSLELPVMGDWNYRKLEIAPCRYTGSVRGENLVIMAHNYPSLFRNLKLLNLSDRVTFTDVRGRTMVYEVVAKDLLDPAEVEEMTAGDYDLTLFTCTYGGASRVTVYCDKVKE